MMYVSMSTTTGITSSRRRLSSFTAAACARHNKREVVSYQAKL
jgi:hypothetical protein